MRPLRNLSVVLGLVVVVVVIVTVGALASSSERSVAAPGNPRTSAPAVQVLQIGAPLQVQPIQPGFIGQSFEYRAIEPYAGADPKAIDPVFEQLIRNLGDGEPPSIRIGGDSTDLTWSPIAGVPKPPGVRYSITPQWLAVTRSLTRAVGARLILGINLEADSPQVATVEARALIHGIGASSVQALELGNEPGLYARDSWGLSGIPGRGPGWDFTTFTRDFSTISRSLPPLPLAGPTIGGTKWFTHLGEFLAAEPRVRIVTLHRYPLQLCRIHPANGMYPTLVHLLSESSSLGLAASVAPYVAMSHATGRRFRIDEMNTISCGKAPAVGRSFASALWALDTMFALASVGVDGVNIHSFPKSQTSLFTLSRRHGRWLGRVAPEYYGLLMFAQAAAPGSRLLHVSGAGSTGVNVWATLSADAHVRVTRVALINALNPRPKTIAIEANGAVGDATVERLEAPGLRSRSEITLGGQSFASPTATGELDGMRRVTLIEPAGGRYVITLPPDSAAIVTLR